MHSVEIGALLIVLVGVLVVQDFRFVQEFMVKTEDFFIFLIVGRI